MLANMEKNSFPPETPLMLCLNTRNGIDVIDVRKVVYLRADGNYTEFVTADGKTNTHLSNLAHFESEIQRLYERNGIPSPFFRLSRSYLINTDYVSSVNLSTQTLSFFAEAVKSLTVSKRLLRTLQAYIYEKYNPSCGQ